MSWSLEQRTGKARKRPWHDDPAVLAEALNRVPVVVGGVLAVIFSLVFLVWLGVPSFLDATGERAWGIAIWRVAETVLGIVFCALTGFLIGKALASLMLRLGLRLAATRWARWLEHRYESLRTQPPERRF